MLALVQWMNPQWGWVLPAAVLLPLAAHLMSQRAGRLAYFPAVRFVAKAVAEQARWRAPRQWLLLLLRVLILALVIAAFAQPWWWRDDQTVSQREQGLAVVLIVDASASMQRTVQGSTLFDTARAQALAALASLDPARDRAMLIILDASPSSVLPRMSANFSAMRDALLTLKPTWEQGHLTAALTLAASPPWDPADRVGTAPLTIHLFGDMQRTQWPDDAQLRTILADKTFVPHDVAASASSENLALHHVTLAPARPVRGQRATVSVEAAYYAPAGHAPLDVHVRMTTTGIASSSPATLVRRVTLAPQVKTRVSFPWQPVDAGPVYIALSIEPASRSMTDALLQDDQTGLHVNVVRAQRVALVTRDSSDDPSSSAYYLARALTPAIDAAVNDVRLEEWSPDSLKKQLGSTSPSLWPACIVMVQTGALDASARDALANYISQGGGVWWLLDSQAAADSLATWQVNENAISPVIPASQGHQQAPDSLQKISRIDGMAHIGQGAYDQPTLGVFEGPSRATMSAIYFTHTFEGRLAPDALSLLDLAHLLPDTQAHPPVLAWRTLGQGRLALFTADISPASSNLVKAPVFLPLVHQMVRSLSPQQTATANPTPGGTTTVSVEASDLSSGLYLLPPDGSRTILPTDKTAGQTGSTGSPKGALLVSLTHLTQPGRYDLHAQSDNRFLGGVQVEMAETESDLTSELPPSALRRVSETAADVPSHNNASSSPAPSVSEATMRERGRPLWPYCLMLAAVLLALESLVGAGLQANTFGRRVHEEQRHA